MSAQLTDEEALNRVASYCSTAEHCRAEINEKLQRWGIAYDTIARILDRLESEKFIDDERFYDAFDWEPEGGGFAPLKKVTADQEHSVEAVTGAHKINVLVACGQTCKTVPKINSIYYFEPGAHTKGDGYLYQTDLSLMYLYFRMVVTARSTASM